MLKDCLNFGTLSESSIFIIYFNLQVPLHAESLLISIKDHFISMKSSVCELTWETETECC